MPNAKPIKNFQEISYLSQVRRLRSFAKIALKQYNIKVHALKFIQHAENATFKVTAVNGSLYLFRIHRNAYHSKNAILEELQWLKKLSQAKLLVPKPVESINKSLVEVISEPELDLTRNCCLFHWIDGRFIDKSLTPNHMFKVGQLIARMQSHSTVKTTRKYWDAEGLLGLQATFGNIDSLSGVSKKDQKQITKARIATLSYLKKYQKKFPNRLGLIHADLHFGNLLLNGLNFGAIDFDDCGFGFYVYDLVIPFVSMQNNLGEKNQRKLESYKNALIKGYSSLSRWDHHDEQIFTHLLTARKLLMLGWLNSRSDNPMLKKYFKGAVNRALKHIATK